MPQEQYTPEQAAALRKYYAAQQAQQQGGQAAEGGQEKKKSKSLTDIVKGTTGAVKRTPENIERFFSGLDGCVGSGVRSAAATFAMTTVGAPILLTNPYTAILTAGFAGAYAFCSTNLAYKLVRDVLGIVTAPIRAPKRTLEKLTGLLNPLKIIQTAIAMPFKTLVTVARYPFRVKRKKRFGDREEIVGTNRYASYIGRLVGGVWGLDVLYPNFIYNLKGMSYTAINRGKNLFGAGARGLASSPKYAYSFAR